MTGHQHQTPRRQETTHLQLEPSPHPSPAKYALPCKQARSLVLDASTRPARAQRVGTSHGCGHGCVMGSAENRLAAATPVAGPIGWVRPRHPSSADYTRPTWCCHQAGYIPRMRRGYLPGPQRLVEGLLPLLWDTSKNLGLSCVFTPYLHTSGSESDSVGHWR